MRTESRVQDEDVTGRHQGSLRMGRHCLQDVCGLGCLCLRYRRTYGIHRLTLYCQALACWAGSHVGGLLHGPSAAGQW
jgi:hypothetical protein